MLRISEVLGSSLVS